MLAERIAWCFLALGFVLGVWIIGGDMLERAHDNGMRAGKAETLEKHKQDIEFYRIQIDLLEMRLGLEKARKDAVREMDEATARELWRIMQKLSAKPLQHEGDKEVDQLHIDSNILGKSCVVCHQNDDFFAKPRSLFDSDDQPGELYSDPPPTIFDLPKPPQKLKTPKRLFVDPELERYPLT